MNSEKKIPSCKKSPDKIDLPRDCFNGTVVDSSKSEDQLSWGSTTVQLQTEHTISVLYTKEKSAMDVLIASGILSIKEDFALF